MFFAEESQFHESVTVMTSWILHWPLNTGNMWLLTIYWTSCAKKDIMLWWYDGLHKGQEILIKF